jgi:taurine-pyruvate aminotransferase
MANTFLSVGTACRQLAGLGRKVPRHGDVRGKGWFIGAELVTDDTKDPMDEKKASVRSLPIACSKALILSHQPIHPGKNTLCFSPALIATVRYRRNH